MTAKKDFKRRVRERQARTGESYTTARAHLVGDPPEKPPEKPPAIPVEEYIELPEAAELGFKCAVTASSQLVAAADPVAVLVRVRDALLATKDDPGTEILRALALRGERTPDERPRTPQQWERWRTERRRFSARISAGIGGANDRGDMLALHVDGRRGTVFVLCLAGFGYPLREVPPPKLPRLFLTVV